MVVRQLSASLPSILQPLMNTEAGWTRQLQPVVLSNYHLVPGTSSTAADNTLMVNILGTSSVIDIGSVRHPV